jgi:hypothetical protein
MSLMDLTWDLADYPNISFSKLIVRSFKHSFFQKKIPSKSILRGQVSRFYHFIKPKLTSRHARQWP